MSDEKDEGPRSDKVEREEAKQERSEMKFGEIVTEPFVEPEVVKGEIIIPDDTEEALSVSEELDTALDEVAAALEKLGVSEKSIALALGLGTRADRNARKALRQSKRDKLKSNNGNNGQGQNNRTVKVDTPK